MVGDVHGRVLSYQRHCRHRCVGGRCSVLDVRSGHMCGSHLAAGNSLLAACF